MSFVMPITAPMIRAQSRMALASMKRVLAPSDHFSSYVLSWIGVFATARAAGESFRLLGLGPRRVGVGADSVAGALRSKAALTVALEMGSLNAHP
jgi:hypothetical protein